MNVPWETQQQGNVLGKLKRRGIYFLQVLLGLLSSLMLSDGWEYSISNDWRVYSRL